MVAWEEQEGEGGAWGVGVEVTRWKMFALQTLDDSIETPRETPLPPSLPVDNCPGFGPIWRLDQTRENASPIIANWHIIN